MSQIPDRRCSRCGTTASADQPFCSNCGAPIDKEVVNPTSLSNEQRLAQQSGRSIPPPPPPPDVDQYATFKQQSNYTPPPLSGPQPAEGTFVSPYTHPTPQHQQMTPAPGSVVPAFTGARRDNTNKILGRIGCGAGLLIVLALALCGGLSYGVYSFISKTASNTTQSYKTSNTTNTGYTTSNNATPAPIPLKTVPLNLTVKYATIMYTITDIKQASSFEDDHGNGTSGMIRVDLKEVNPTGHDVIVGYSEIVRLVLPDQSSIAPTDYKKLSPPANGASQDNWLDFPVPSGTAIDKLALRFGTPQEAQMDVPLASGANLAKFQDVTVKPNTSTTCAGLKWTLTSATLSWSADSKQAETGKRYVTINVSIDNPTTTAQNAYWGDYLRLKGGNLTSSPATDATIPLSFAAYSTGVTGSASFLVPQDSTSFSMVLLGDKIVTGSPQTTIDFHIP